MPSLVIPVLENGLYPYIVTEDRTVKFNREHLNVVDAANNLRHVSHNSGNSVIIVSDSNFELRRQSVEALQNAGFTDIKTIDFLSITVSSRIFNLPLNCVIGEPVLVHLNDEIPSVYTPPFVVIQKCENGWQIICTEQKIDNICEKHPSVRNIVFSKSNSSTTEMQTLFPDKKFHESTVSDPNFKEMFIKNYVNNGKLNGYEVLPYCAFDVGIVIGYKSDIIKLSDKLPPCVFGGDFDVGDAAYVKAVATVNDDLYVPLIKHFNFKSKAHRIVSVNAEVDAMLLPTVTFKTVSTYSPPEKTTPVIYTVRYVKPTNYQNLYELRSIFSDRVFDEGRFETTDQLFIHMAKHFSMETTKDIYYFITADSCKRSQLREFRTSCQKAGYTNPKFITAESVKLSILLDCAKVSFNRRTLVAVLMGNTYQIVGRDGSFLKILKRDKFLNFDGKTSKVSIIVLDNLAALFTKTDIEYLSSNCSQQCEVRIISSQKELLTSMVKHFWSRTNGTHFDGNFFNDYGDFELVIQHGKITERIDTRFTQIPYVVTASYQIPATTVLSISTQGIDAVLEKVEEFNVVRGMLAEVKISVKTACDITVEMKNVTTEKYRRRAPRIVELPMPTEDLNCRKDDEEADSKKTKPDVTEMTKPVDLLTTAESVLSNHKLNPTPSAILTFTSDNRVVIETDERYTGNSEILAYVRLQSGQPPQTGKVPFTHLTKHPGSVFYDITRLLATNFDPDHPDPAWSFKTSRDADSKVIVYTRKATTYPLVLFGVVIRSTLLYIREHTKSEITSLGIKLPIGSTVSDNELEEVAKRVGVKLTLLT